MRRIVWVLALALLLALLGGCHSEPAKKVMRYDIPAPVANLDPQFATDAAARMILANIGEGLLVQAADGTLHPGAAEQYTTSPDGRTYTFHLRKEAGWAGKEFVPVVAEDFVFAFRRLFDHQAASPFARDFILIQNAAQVLAGSLPATELGVKALDDYTLSITLEHQSPLFLELLASTAAMPCNPAAFDASRGRYGLERQYTSCNGPFAVDSWSDSQINLRPNANYGTSRAVAAGGVNLYIGRENPEERVVNGGTDAGLLSFGAVSRLTDPEITVTAFQKTTWCIAFNQNSPVWGNPLLRQSLAHALDSAALTGRLAGNLSPAGLLVSPAALLLDKPYRELVDIAPPLAFDPDAATRLLAMGLEALELEGLPATDLIVPDTGGHSQTMGLVQQSWQKHASVYVNIVAVPAEELESRFWSGDYELMLLPFTPAGPRVETLLGAFTTTSGQNGFGYYNDRYDERLAEALDASTLEAAAFRFSQVELTLLADAVVIPVYNEASYYATGKGVTGLEFFPFGDKVVFRGGNRP